MTTRIGILTAPDGRTAQAEYWLHYGFVIESCTSNGNLHIVAEYIRGRVQTLGYTWTQTLTSGRLLEMVESLNPTQRIVGEFVRKGSTGL